MHLGVLMFHCGVTVLFFILATQIKRPTFAYAFTMAANKGDFYACGSDKLDDKQYDNVATFHCPNAPVTGNRNRTVTL